MWYAQRLTICAHLSVVCLSCQLVFMTALFYLLCFSEGEYLPVSWLTDILDQEGTPHKSRYTQAFSRAIR